MFSSCCRGGTGAPHWRCHAESVRKLEWQERPGTRRRGSWKGRILFDVLLLACMGLAFVASETVITFLELAFGSVVAAETLGRISGRSARDREEV